MNGTKQVVTTVFGSLLLLTGLVFWYAYEPNNNISQHNPELEEELDVSEELLELEDVEISNDLEHMNENKAVITTNYGEIVLELFADEMPITVGNFVSLANDGFYDGTKFHRIIPGFMIQGGDPNTKLDDSSLYGQGGPGYTIQDEFVSVEHLSNVEGTISMANTGQPNSGGSQFFINVADNTNLDFDKMPMESRHPVFGRVTSGMDVVREIEQVETGPSDLPVNPVVIESINIQ